MSAPRTPVNPFRYGREAEVLVDRETELARVVRVAQDCGTLFLIGPRRYGKTSILRAAEEEATARGVVVLRYDAEAYDSVGTLAAALLAGVLRKYSSAFERAQASAKKFFLSLKPSLSIDPADGKITVEVGVSAAVRAAGIPMLTDVLNGIERMAAADGRKALVVLDEFQQIIIEAGERAERQIRAAVQTHRNVGYVFAGSSSRMMTEMIATSNRAFWQLGDQLHLGPVPRAAFSAFLKNGFKSADVAASDAALARILDLAEDVPFNIQQLAHECFTLALEGRRGELKPALVEEALSRVVSNQHSAYLQRWLMLSQPQKRTLKAVLEEPEGFQLTEVARRRGLPRTTMVRALEVLEAQHFVRQDLSGPSVRWRPDDPFLRAWLGTLETL